MPDNYRRFLILLVLLGGYGPAIAWAQATFEPGYLVRAAGDTTRGQVQVVSDLRSTKACRFRAGAAAATQEYAPTQLRAYGVAGGPLFESRLVPAADSGGAAQPLFVQLLVAGPATLYTCRDQPGRTRYFLAMGTGRLRELAQRRVRTFANSFEAYETRFLYRDTLAAALTGCPVVQTQLPALPFQPAALVRTVSRYNECVSSPAARPRFVAGPATQAAGPVISLLAGGLGGTMRLGAATETFFNLAPDLHQTSLTGGVALSQTMPQTRQALTLRLEVLYAHEAYAGTYIGPVPTAAAPSTQTNTYQFDLRYLHVPLLGRYTRRRGSGAWPFVEAGLHYSRLLSAQSHFTQAISFPAIAPVALPFFQGNAVEYNQFGLVVGAGVTVPVLAARRLGLLARYATASGPSSYADITAPIGYWQVLLSLDINRP